MLALVFVTVYLAGLVAVGVVKSRKVKDETAFLLAGRSLTVGLGFVRGLADAEDAVRECAATGDDSSLAAELPSAASRSPIRNESMETRAALKSLPSSADERRAARRP